jgi:hypothetical protein
MGDGFALRTALTATNFDAITLIPGDGTYRRDGIARMLRASAAADLVITYRENRPLTSLLTRFVLNLCFGLWLVDHESLIIYPVKWLRELPPDEDGRDYQIRALISLLRLGLTHVQVPVSLNPAARGWSLKTRFCNYLNFMISVFWLLLIPPRASPAASRRTRILQILAGRVRGRQNDRS